MKTRFVTTLFAVAATLVLSAAETPKVGDKAPDFTAKDQEGNTIKLSDFAGKQAVLLYFYPKDNTPGCTKQACGLRDRMDSLKKDNVAVIGVSMDDAESHKKFIKDHNLNFTLVTDTDGTVTDLYGAKMGNRKMSRRLSLLIDKNGKITHVTDTPAADKHLAEMKVAVEKLGKSS